MKIRADISPAPLPSSLERILQDRRASRAFDPAAYLERKVELIDRHDVCSVFGYQPVILDVAVAARTIDDTVAEGLNTLLPLESSSWGSGQLVSYTRTPFLYYVATMLHDNGHRAVIAGTTNYSEGSYLGYIGKASDAMVDVQLISDLYKSEVYALAEHLGVPESICSAAPTGDMFDACTDEEVFGATYDFVELFLEYLNDRAAENCDLTPWVARVNKEDQNYFTRHAQSLKALHQANKHKYLAGSPAVHLDVRRFPLNVWKIQTWKKEN